MTRPAARIEVDGVDITDKLVGADRPLISLTVSDEAGIKSDTLSIELDNREGLAAFPVGANVKVWLGYEPQPVYMGAYLIDGWTKRGGRRALEISAKAAEMTSAIKETKLRSWHDTTIGEIVRTIADEHGRGAVISADQEGRPIAHIDQQGESDMGFLTRLAMRNGAIFKLADGKVLFTSASSDTLPSGAANDAVLIVPFDASDWSVTEGERGKHGKVICYYRDRDDAKRKQVSAGGGSPVHRERKLYATKAEAQAAASAKLGDLAQGSKTGSITCTGNPALFAEGKIQLEDFDPECDGVYFAKSVTHSFSSSGYTTTVSFQTSRVVVEEVE